MVGIALLLLPFGVATNAGAVESASVYAQASGIANPANPGSLHDVTLKRAAAAYVKVRDISMKAEQEMNNTNDTARKQQLMVESESAKVAAVKEEGMEPQQYNNVIQMVSADDALQRRFLSYVQELKHS
jgi:hypothetical protein